MRAPEVVVDGFPKRRARWVEIATSADHKDVGRILIVASLGFLFVAADRAAADAAAAGDPGEHLPLPRRLQPHALDVRGDGDLPLRRAARRRLLPLRRAAADRRPLDGAAAGQPARRLARDRGRDRALLRLPLHPLGGRGQPAAAALGARLQRQRRGRCLDLGDRPGDARLRPDRDRPDDDDAQDAGPGDGLAATARLLLGRGDRLLADAGDRPGLPRGADDAARSTATSTGSSSPTAPAARRCSGST